MTHYLLSRLRHCTVVRTWSVLAFTLLAPGHAHASFLQGEALDKVANAMSWLVLVLVPIVGIVAFWLVHILPEKIAEKKQHPQAHAIQCLCLMSLVFGGLLWPLAWLWAYTKPVFYKMAYGTDVDESIGHGKKEADKIKPDAKAEVLTVAAAPVIVEAGEMERLRTRIAELESQVKTKGGQV